LTPILPNSNHGVNVESKGVKFKESATMVYGYIYKIVNTINNKVYIGQTIQTPSRRKTEHFYHLRKNQHDNPHLQFAFNKYGESNFKFTVLNYATDKKILDKLEDDYIVYYDCLNDDLGYNLKTGGANGKHSEKTKLKISSKMKGPNSYWYGKKRAKFSKEHLKKMSDARMGKNHPLYGKSHDNKTKMKMSEVKRGKGLFGFTGVTLDKNCNAEKRCWNSRIRFNMHPKHLGTFEDPLSGEIIHDLVLNEIRRG